MNTEKIPPYVHFRCRTVRINRSVKKIGISYRQPLLLSKQEIDHDEIHENSWENKDEWLPYLKNDVLSTASSYSRYTKGMENLTAFEMKDSLTLLGLANEYFNNLRDEKDEALYTYNDEYTRHSVRNSVKGGRCVALNEYYESSNSDKVFNIISTELNVKGNICEILNKYFELMNKHRKIIEDDFDSQFEDSRDINQEDRTKRMTNLVN